MSIIEVDGLPKKDFWGRNKNLLIIGGGILQHQTLVECNKLGLGKILVDGDLNCYCAKSYLFNEDYFIQASTKESEVVLSQVKKWLKKHRKVKIVGVYTQGQDCAYTVAYVAKHLGLPSIGIDVAYRTNNKIAMREAFEDFDIPQPMFDCKLNFPYVVKSTDNCASRGLTIVRKQSEVEQAIDYAISYSSDGEYLCEEFIDGKEYSVDTVVYKGRVYPGGISDRVFLDKNKYAVQDGSITPSFLPEETQQRMYWIMQDCAKALGVKWGAFKGDLIIDKYNHIYVLEVTARLSGGFDSQFRKPYSYGINLIKATIDLACGKELDFADLIPQWNKFSQTFTVFPKPGIIKEIRGEEELRMIPGIRQVFITKHVGQLVEYKTCADRVIHIIACADTYKELQETIQKARETIQFITE
uniref:ATP-grasp domain-containing protein n=1 Tax=viral metagenome TaxID=1070528 RepID=A0A6M3LR24_9ZZZZ